MGFSSDISLDVGIRNWVLIPITIVMFLVFVLRHYLMFLLQNPSGTQLSASPATALQEQQILQRARIFRSNCNLLCPRSFHARVQGYTNPENGLLNDPKTPPPNPMMDPSSMMEGMKGNIGNMIPSMVLMSWISSFFQGFIVVKTPFPLFDTLRPMLHRGLSLPALPVSYVSSLSWYFLNLTGLRGILSLVLGDSNAVDFRAMGSVSPQFNSGLNIKKAFAAEKDNLIVLQHRPCGENMLLDSD